MIHIPAPPEAHLPQPEPWQVTMTDARAFPKTIMATAISIVDDVLILWRNEVVVGVYKAGTWKGVRCKP